MLVTELPIWDDCPFRKHVPVHIEIRLGVLNEIDTIAFWDPEAEIHVAVPKKSFDRRSSLEAILRNMNYFRDHKEGLQA